MSEKKIALVLEGGGMRGAYTAGALSWFIDEGIDFDYAYGISTGAVHLSSFALKNKDYLKECSTDYIASKEIIGLKPFLREGRIVGYDYLFGTLLPSKNVSFDKVHELDKKLKIGVYDMDKGLTEYLSTEDINSTTLKAAASLPVIGKIVNYNGKKYLDGGITEMIPIKEAVADGNDRFFVITTKPIDYVRKPAKWIVKFVMKLCYPKYPSVEKDYAVRHLNYNDQISRISRLVEEGKAVYMYPSVTPKVSRLRGSREDLLELYELGRSDMERRRDEIFALLED